MEAGAVASAADIAVSGREIAVIGVPDFWMPQSERVGTFVSHSRTHKSS
jgi:hypothetical protein